MIFKPAWNWRALALIGISCLFWLLFTSITVFFSEVVMNHIISERTLKSTSGILLVSCLSLASFFWARELLKLRNIHYHVRFTDSALVWTERGLWKNRETKIDLASIEFFDHYGSPSMGYSLVITTKIKTHRLGLLLSRNDIYQLSKLIETARTKQG